VRDVAPGQATAEVAGPQGAHACEESRARVRRDARVLAFAAVLVVGGIIAWFIGAFIRLSGGWSP
jgi:hypothetical protein